MNFKNTLRLEIEDKLSRLENQKVLSQDLTLRVTSTDQWSKSDSIFLFISFKNEVNTEALINQGIKDKKKIYAPLIDKKSMGFYRIDNIDFSKLVLNSYGIFEPPTGLKEEFPKKNSLMLIPGVSFTKTGSRLGRGGGYYDRYLSQHTNTTKIGITFSIQLKEHIELEPWDILMDMVITENDTFYRGAYNGNN